MIMSWPQFYEKHKHLGYDECLRRFRIMERLENDQLEQVAYDKTVRTGKSVGFAGGGGSYPKLAIPSLSVAVNISDPTTLIVSWSSVPHAQSYTVDFDITPEFFSLQLLYTGENLAVVSSNLLPGVTYYYRVRANSIIYRNSDFDIAAGEIS